MDPNELLDELWSPIMSPKEKNLKTLLWKIPHAIRLWKNDVVEVVWVNTRSGVDKWFNGIMSNLN